MDFVLSVADNIVLDKVWATLVPAAAFYPTNTSHFYNPAWAVSGSSSAWLNLVSHLPHPSEGVLAHQNALPPAYETPALLSRFNSAPAVLSAWPRNYIPRQLASLMLISVVGAMLLYFVFATFSYYLVFNHDMMRHPRFLKNQIRLEIVTSLKAFPVMALLTLPWFQAEVMGYSRLYDDPKEWGYTYLVLSIPLYLLFTDYLIYWIHRWLHHPILYKRLHKPHHKWIIPTPFASHAFHPVDGYAQSIPYHLFIVIFPLQRYLYLVLFVCVNFWSIFIHDSDMITGHALEKVINGPAHHTLHHLYFTCNYGQYFTWADRAGGSYRQPESSLDPLLEVKMLDKNKSK